jgi:choline dehydrogenase
VAAGYPLTVKTNTFVTRVLFDQSHAVPKAVGVEYLEGEYLYRASPLSGNTGLRGTAKATKEIILSGGAFNSVQMLKLSGIGPRAELDHFAIPVVQDLQGVGRNLQDRYEIPVTVKHEEDFELLDGCTFDAKEHDECYRQWAQNPHILNQKGPYTTNGLAAAMVMRSDFASTSDNDLFIFGGPINFVGYYPQWGDASVADHKHFSWYALKAHTCNKAGTVELRSSDPLDPPIINFNYFDTGTTSDGADVADLRAMVQAVNISRQALSRYSDYDFLGGSGFQEERPGPEITTEAEIEDYVKANAWGHHASCTNPIGADDDPMAVLDSRFRVRGTTGLRVVDASVFPRIPGIFIQAPIYIVSEKAADVILDAWS